MNYLTDNPWPLIILLVGAALVLVLILPGRGKPAGLICLIAAVLLWFVEGAIISPAERIELQAAAILQDLQQRDLESLSTRISADSPELLEMAERGMELVDLGDDFKLKIVDVEVSGETRGVARIRGNGTFTERSSGFSRTVPTFWSTEWALVQDVWRLTEVTRLDPVTGKEMGTFDRR